MNLPFLLVNFLPVVDPLLPLVLLILPSPILLLLFSLLPPVWLYNLLGTLIQVFVIQINGMTTCPLNKEVIHTVTKKNSDKYGIQTSDSSARTHCYQLVRSHGTTT